MKRSWAHLCYHCDRCERTCRLPEQCLSHECSGWITGHYIILSNKRQFSKVMVGLPLVFLTESSWNVCLCWFTRTVGARRHKLGGLKQHNRILWQSWRPEVQNGGVGRAVHQGRRSQAFLSAPGGCPQPCSPWGCCCAAPGSVAPGSVSVFPPCVCVSYKGMRHVRAARGLTLGLPGW